MIFGDKQVLCVDFETFYDPSKEVGYDLKTLSIAEYVRDTRFFVQGMAWITNGKTGWTTRPQDVFGEIDWDKTILVSHNIKFDGTIIAWRYNHSPALYVDTQVLARAVIGQNSESYSLKATAKYLGLPEKGDILSTGVQGARNPSPEQMEKLKTYCIRDVEICRDIYTTLMPLFPPSQLKPMDWTIRCFTEPKLKLDIPLLEKGVADEKIRRESLIANTGIDRSVFSSNKQFATLLGQYGVRVPTKISKATGKTVPAFAKTDPGLAALEKTHPALYAARIASKSSLLETRGEALIHVARTGSFPFDVGFSGAVGTHRYSGGSGGGGNPQNFTRGSFLRGAVSAPAGYSMVVGDYAQIELRLLAWLAREPKLINAIMADIDIYCQFGSMYYKRTITKKDLLERMFGKSSILGLGYNMGAEKFQAKVKQDLKLDITYEQAQEAVFLYRETYFNVPKLWGFAQRCIPLIAKGEIGCLFFAPYIKVSKEALTLPSGLRIQYPNLRYEDREWVYDDVKEIALAERMQRPPNLPRLYGGKLIENICQALAGELCKEGIARAEANGLRCVGQVHDEIIAICRQDTLKGESEAEAVKLLQTCMEMPPRWMPSIKLKAEVGYGQNWLDAKA